MQLRHTIFVLGATVWPYLKKCISVGIKLGVLGAVIIFGIYYHIFILSRPYLYRAVEQVPPSQVAIILGAQVYLDGRLSDMVRDRADTAIELYRAGKVPKILISGDHGRSRYDEVNSIRKYVLQQGVPPEAIFLDHAGFDTYDTVYRAKAIFQIDSAIIVTQDFHLPRAVYVGRASGLNAVGMVADRQGYYGVIYNYLREVPARVKAFGDVFRRARPQYLGEPIPITAPDGKASWDQLE